MSATTSNATTLRRAINLPMLVFYGVGVTVGAGIFALSGKILGIAGDQAPLSFFIAALIAATTAVSYAVLTSTYPKAAGEAYFVRLGLGRLWGQTVGIGLVVTAITSSAAITLAFAGHLGTLVALPHTITVIAVLALLAGIATKGVKETVIFAALITIVEIGILLIVITVGMPQVINDGEILHSLIPNGSWENWGSIFSGALIAFFAYMGFEDIINMGEETVDAKRTVPLAIVMTLVITLLIYGLVSLVAVTLPDRAGLVASPAPLTFIYESITGRSGSFISAAASVAIINGVLIQIVMASRVLYGMATDGVVWKWLGSVHAATQTPVNSIVLVTVLVALAALTLPLVQLARLTSLILLSIFSLVNFSLWRLGRSQPIDSLLFRWHRYGLIALLPSAGLLTIEILNLIRS